MALTGVIDPSRLDACVHDTSRVFSESKGLSDSGESCGFWTEGVLGIHHLMVMFRSSASATQLAMLASWSTADMTISEPAGKYGRNATDKLRYS